MAKIGEFHDRVEQARRDFAARLKLMPGAGMVRPKDDGTFDCHFTDDGVTYREFDAVGPDYEVPDGRQAVATPSAPATGGTAPPLA